METNIERNNVVKFFKTRSHIDVATKSIKQNSDIFGNFILTRFNHSIATHRADISLWNIRGTFP